MRAAWIALVLLNAVLAVAAAFATFPFVVLVRGLLAEQGWTTIDPTLVDDGLVPVAFAAVLAGVLLAVIALPANLIVARATGLEGRVWPVVASIVLIGGGLLISRWGMADLW